MSKTPSKIGKPKKRTSWVWLAAVPVLLGVVVAAVTASRDHTSDAPESAVASSSLKGVVGGDFHSLVADPTTPGRLFVGGHQAVSRSDDGGKTWKLVKVLDNADAMGWSFTDTAVYVTGHPGINRSTDKANTFERANAGLPDTDVHAFGASDSTLYAAGPNLGVSASTDGGQTWTTRSQNAGQSFFGRILLDGEDALVAADARFGAVGSGDGGRTWRRLGGPPAATWVSRSGQTLYASGQQAAKSTDGGTTWTNVTLPVGATIVEADPNDPEVVYAGVHRGDAVTVWVSRDAGAHWARP